MRDTKQDVSCQLVNGNGLLLVKATSKKHLAFSGDLADQKNIEDLVNKGFGHTGGFDIVLHVPGGGYGFGGPRHMGSIGDPS